MTTNEPDIADVWRETFDDPAEPAATIAMATAIARRSNGQDTIRVKTRGGIEDRPYKFRKTHHGPIVAQGKRRSTILAARVANVDRMALIRQALAMVKATNLDRVSRGDGGE